MRKFLVMGLVLLLLLSVSALALANPVYAGSEGNEAEIDEEDGKLYLPNDTASEAAGNPIRVSGK